MIRLCDLISTSLIMLCFTLPCILYIMTLENTLLSRLVPSVLTDAHCVLTYINLFVDSFQKERSWSHEEPREPFYPPVVNHFINLRRIMLRVKRRPEVNVSSAPSLSRGTFLLIYFRRLPLQLRTNIIKSKRIDMISSYLESIKIRAK